MCLAPKEAALNVYYCQYIFIVLAYYTVIIPVLVVYGRNKNTDIHGTRKCIPDDEVTAYMPEYSNENKKVVFDNTEYH
jgi:hypothetical protein